MRYWRPAINAGPANGDGWPLGGSAGSDPGRPGAGTGGEAYGQ